MFDLAGLHDTSYYLLTLLCLKEAAQQRRRSTLPHTCVAFLSMNVQSCLATLDAMTNQAQHRQQGQKCLKQIDGFSMLNEKIVDIEDHDVSGSQGQKPHVTQKKKKKSPICLSKSGVARLSMPPEPSTSKTRTLTCPTILDCIQTP